MGGDKPLALLAGRSLLDRAIALAQTWTGDTAVSLRHAGQYVVPEGVFSLLDRSGAGPLAGLQASLDFARGQGLGVVLTIPCDVPFAPGDLAEKLCAALAPDACAALAASGGVLHPACALWKTSALEALPDYRATGQSSLRGFAAHVGFTTAQWPCEPFDPFFNVNSPEDLAVAEALLKNR